MRKHSLRKVIAVVLIATAVAGLTGCGIGNSKTLSREERAEYLKLKGQVAAQVNKDETSNLIKETESSEINIENLTPETYGNFIKFYKNYIKMNSTDFKSGLDTYKSILSDEIYNEILNDYNANGNGYVNTNDNKSNKSETLPDTVYLCKIIGRGLETASAEIAEGKFKGSVVTVPNSAFSSFPKDNLFVLYTNSVIEKTGTYVISSAVKKDEYRIETSNIEKVEEYNSSNNYKFYSDDTSSSNTMIETTTAEETSTDAADAHKNFRIDSCESYSNVVLVKGTINSNTTLFKLTLDKDSKVTKIEKFTIDTGKGNTKR